MPFSDAQGKDVALNWYQKIAPGTVVDIGTGAGTYAKLMRGSDQPGAMWVAIEAWEPYLDEYGLHDLYDHVLVADARHLQWPLFGADLVIAGDVLEHMTADEARSLIKRIKFAAKNLIVSIPVLHLDQGAVHGNPFERHVDHWTAEDMAKELGDHVVASWVGDVLAYFWWAA